MSFASLNSRTALANSGPDCIDCTFQRGNIMSFVSLHSNELLIYTGLLTALASCDWPGWPDCIDCGFQRGNIMSFASLYSSKLLT